MTYGSKTTAHIQRNQTWIKAVLSLLGPKWVKLVNPGPGNPYPGLKALIRFWCDDWAPGAIARGAEGGKEYARRLGPSYKALGYGDALELPNEPDVNSPAGIANLVAFTIACVTELATMGIPAAIGCISVGNPYGPPAEVEDKIKRLAPMFLPGSYPKGVRPAYWCYHAYWSRLKGIGPNDPDCPLRYRWIVRVLKGLGFDPYVTPCLLSEAGSDAQIGNLRPADKAGWQATGTKAQYLQDLLEFERLIREDGYVEAAMLFTLGYEKPWGSFDHNEGMMNDIAKQIKPLGPVPEGAPAPPKPGTTPDNPIVSPPLAIVERKFTPTEFSDYAKGLKLQGTKKGIFLHHTYRPLVTDWKGIDTIRAMKRVYEETPWQDDDGLYRKGWLAGPHLFVGPDGIWVFWPLTKDGWHAGGVHNVGTIGLEMVGDYDVFRPSGAVLENTLAALGILFRETGLPATGLRFHRDVSTKTCPGKAVTKEWIIPLVEAWMAQNDLKTQLRNACYNGLRPYPPDGLPYNSTFAFPKYATEQGLGAPLALAFDKLNIGGVTYAVAAYAGGIVHCRDGDWGATTHITW